MGHKGSTFEFIAKATRALFWVSCSCSAKLLNTLSKSPGGTYPTGSHSFPKQNSNFQNKFYGGQLPFMNNCTFPTLALEVEPFGKTLSLIAQALEREFKLLVPWLLYLKVACFLSGGVKSITFWFNSNAVSVEHCQCNKTLYFACTSTHLLAILLRILLLLPRSPSMSSSWKAMCSNSLSNILVLQQLMIMASVKINTLDLDAGPPPPPPSFNPFHTRFWNLHRLCTGSTRFP